MAWVGSKNTAARSLFKKLGFTGNAPEAFENDEDDEDPVGAMSKMTLAKHR